MVIIKRKFIKIKINNGGIMLQETLIKDNNANPAPIVAGIVVAKKRKSQK